MFRASVAHPQEALHEHSFSGCSVLLYGRCRLFTGYGEPVNSVIKLYQDARSTKH
jgi:hypothetical protein